LPLLMAMLSPSDLMIASVAAGSLVCLSLLGTLAARAGGAGMAAAAARVTLWGALAMAATAGVGMLFGTVS
jgi:VIT1/CCC1 family predicted Fe2+/Mn2+ transporter